MFITRSDSQLLPEIYLQIIRPVCNLTVKFVATLKKEREKKRHLRMSVGLHLCSNLPSSSSSGQNIPVRINPQSAKHCRGKIDTSLLRERLCVSIPAQKYVVQKTRKLELSSELSS